MTCTYRFLLITGFLFTNIIYCIAQGQGQNQGPWPNAESQKLYYKGRDFLTAGQIQPAINTYEQAMALAPDKMIIQRDLGKAYFYGKRYDEAIKVLENVINSMDADDQVYQLLADCRHAKGENKKSRNTFMEGIERFPNSGLLYHELGKYYEDEGNLDDALDMWLEGIQKAPAYHINYYEAAHTYMNTSRVIWGILYGEIFVNMESETLRSFEVRKMIMDGYGKLFSSNPAELSEIRRAYSIGTADFESAVYNTYMKLAPIMDGGITIENLIILRTRFLIEWNAHFADTFPFTLFAYEDAMVRNGNFDAYNQFLFGKIVNEMGYKSWSKEHADAIERFQKDHEAQPLKPVAADFYNDKQIAHLFLQTKH